MAVIGKLKERVTIESFSETKDSYGQPIRTWSTIYTLWAQHVPTSGSEVFETDEKTARRFATFRVRYQGLTINETMRLTWNGQTFNIVSIEKAEFNDLFTLRCLGKDNV